MRRWLPPGTCGTAAGCSWWRRSPPVTASQAARVGDGFAVAVYPFIDGQSFESGEFSSPAHRLGVLGLVAGVHTAPAEASRHAMADDFAVPGRDELEAACDLAGDVADCGPYARAVSLLVRQNAMPIRRLLGRYDRLVMQARAVPGPDGSHPRRAASGQRDADADEGWRLIDWDTVLVAPPERDLWDLDPGDGSVLDAYAGGDRASARGPCCWICTVCAGTSPSSPLM